VPYGSNKYILIPISNGFLSGGGSIVAHIPVALTEGPILRMIFSEKLKDKI